MTGAKITTTDEIIAAIQQANRDIVAILTDLDACLPDGYAIDALNVIATYHGTASGFSKFVASSNIGVLIWPGPETTP